MTLTTLGSIRIPLRKRRAPPRPVCAARGSDRLTAPQRGRFSRSVALMVALGAASPGRSDAADPALVYTTPAKANYLRMTIEEIGILGLGVLQYATVRSNESDWAVAPEWSGLRSKLLWEAAAFDDNRFDTNWLTHPGAGFLYYSAARGNRLGVFPSLGVAALASTVWEEVGELREQVAINDLVVTPLSALPLGESAFQLGTFFHRGRRTPALTALGWIFAPLKSVHDALDGVTPQRSDRVDDLGLPADVWHHFGIGVSAGLNTQQRGSTQYDGRAFIHSDLVTLPGYRREGTRSVAFGSGQVTSIRGQLGASSGGIRDLLLGASAVAAGWYWRDVRLDGEGHLRGSEVLTGFRFLAEYTQHDYDRDGRRPSDRLALVAVGAAVEHTVHVKAMRLTTRLDVLGDFAGVDAYALPGYLGAHDGAGLTSVLRTKQYYHAYGATIRPQLELAIGRFDAGGEARFDGFRSVEKVDAAGPLPHEVSAADRRLSARAWMGVTAARHARLFLLGERNERSGNVGATYASRSELGLYFGTEIVF